ncbi:MAG: hypothetical protein HeimC3_24410 [Candidatus Heimdallarchaeota archaeon LC_3]|nr:MAG: hypothetical protein HeimC3_24410 [Candidatus Heimdallarchaeota archaeon LC_3]
MSIEEEIYRILKKKLVQLIEEKNLSFCEAANATSMLSDEFSKVIKKRFP